MRWKEHLLSLAAAGETDTGRIQVMADGVVGVSSGFHPDLTGAENIRMKPR